MKRVYTGHQGWDTQMVRDLLSMNDIEVVLDTEDLAGDGTWTMADVWVANDEDEARALEILAEFDPEASQHPRETGPTWPWRCPRCGEDVEPQFGACWNCGAERPD